MRLSIALLSAVLTTVLPVYGATGWDTDLELGESCGMDLAQGDLEGAIIKVLDWHRGRYDTLRESDPENWTKQGEMVGLMKTSLEGLKFVKVIEMEIEKRFIDAPTYPTYLGAFDAIFGKSRLVHWRGERSRMNQEAYYRSNKHFKEVVEALDLQ